MADESLLERFAAQARDFELTFVDDDWRRMAAYFTDDAVYETVGEGGERFEGRSAVLAALKRAVTSFDRRCDSRLLSTTDGPRQLSSEVHRSWSCKFTLAGAPDLVIYGEERAVYRDGLIVILQETLNKSSREQLTTWVAAHGDKLSGR